MKLDKLFIALTVAGLATMLVSISGRDGRLAFDAVGNLLVANGQAGAYNNWRWSTTTCPCAPELTEATR